MNKIIIAILLLQLSFSVSAQYQTRTNAKGKDFPAIKLQREYTGLWQTVLLKRF